MNPIDILREAQWLISTHGHVKRLYEHQEGFCAMGAIYRACELGIDRRPVSYMAARHAAISALADEIAASGGGVRLSGPEEFVIRYNDDPATTSADVLARFEAAIRRMSREAA